MEPEEARDEPTPTDESIDAPPRAPPAEPAPGSPPEARAARIATRWLEPGSRRRRLVVAAMIYLAVVAVFAAVAGSSRMTTHTPFNHYAHLADAWLHGRQDLRFGAPGYAMNNDFAEYHGKIYISFPPFPALLMLPLVAASGSPENFMDGQFVVWLSGIGPAVLFLVLEKLRRTGRSPRTEVENLGLALVFAFGTVYFFTAVQGTVWFAAHVVGVGLLAIYLLLALDAERPALAGLVLACMWMTRPPTVVTGIFFVLEAIRVCCRDLPAYPGASFWRRLDKRAIAVKLAWLGAPVVLVGVLSAYLNGVRFGTYDPTAFGHEHLPWVRGSRLEAWGLFGYHYLAKNLGCLLTSLPYLPPRGAKLPGDALFQVNQHGLALWFTSPFFLWVLWPRKTGYLYYALVLAMLPPLLFTLMYQNTGWAQFGQRFSNDYSIFLVLLFAVGARPTGALFKAACAWSVAWNLFGAVTFERERYTGWYFHDRATLYQPD